MYWHLSHRFDPAARQLADRHYNRQKVGTPQFVPPGRCLVLLSDREDAFWVTSWPFAQYVKHAWGGAWLCSAFRSESTAKASLLIRQAIAATRHHYGEPPGLGFVSFIDRSKVKPIKRHGIDTWGFTWKQAGFHQAGETKGGLLVMQLSPIDMPAASPALPQMGTREFLHKLFHT